MAEFLMIYDENRRPVGQIAPNEAPPQGKYCLSAEVWAADSSGLLLQKLGAALPGCCADGPALGCEDSFGAASRLARRLSENVQQFHFLGCRCQNGRLIDSWLFVFADSPETAGFGWVTPEECRRKAEADDLPLPAAFELAEMAIKSKGRVLSPDGAELWDVYDADRRPVGRFHRRGEPVPDGDYHLVVNIWTINDAGKILLTQRDPRKPFGLYWECTGGAVTAGEGSFLGALREVKEEAGLDFSGCRPYLLDSERRRNDFLDSWLFFVEGEPAVTLQEGETVDYRWVTLEECLQMAEEGLVVPSIRSLNLLDYAMRHWPTGSEVLN